MKNKKNRQKNIKPTNWPWKTIFGAFILVFGVLYLLNSSEDKTPQEKPLVAIQQSSSNIAPASTTAPLENQKSQVKVDSNVQIITKKLVQNVTSRFVPVFIYELVDTNSGIFIGCGTLFKGNSGMQIATAEHLFGKKGGTKQFAYSVLRPFDGETIYGIERVFFKRAQIMGTGKDAPDIVILKPGDTKPIRCFSLEDEGFDSSQIKIKKSSEGKKLMSLISGKWYPVIGTAMLRDDNKYLYHVLEYGSGPGESGAGFIDEHDNLYILKGGGKDSDTLSEEWIKIMGPTKGTAFVSGPYTIR